MPRIGARVVEPPRPKDFEVSNRGAHAGLVQFFKESSTRSIILVL